MTTGDPPPLRIGTSERSAAMKALDEHLAAGRLDVDEYAERSATAANATVANELAALFTDLPAPHPELPGTTAAVSLAKPPAGGAVAARADGVVERLGLGGWGPRVVAVMPIVAVALFFLTRQWLWFLLIPAIGALVYGAGVGRDDGDQHRQDRRERRGGR